MNKRYWNILFTVLITVSSFADNSMSNQSVAIQEEPPKLVAPKSLTPYTYEAACLVSKKQDPINLTSDDFFDTSTEFKKALVPLSVKSTMMIMKQHGCTNFDFSRVDSTNGPNIYALIEKLCAKLEIDMPRIYVSHDEKLVNCFALDGVMILGYSWLYWCTQDQTEFTIAHELGHLKQKHARKLLATGIVLSLPVLATQVYGIKTIGVKSYFHPTRELKQKFAFGAAALGLTVLARLVMRAYQRQCEYEADQCATTTTGFDKSRIASFFTFLRTMENLAPAPTTALQRMVSYVGSCKWFRTHPTPEERLHNAEKFAN